MLILLAVCGAQGGSDEPTADSADGRRNVGTEETDKRRESADAPVDFNIARQLMQKLRQGQRLTSEERAYIERARATRQAGATGRPRPAEQTGQTGGSPFPDLTPLTDLGADKTYKDQKGGLYGAGRNAPPEKHLQAALTAAQRIQPLNAQGQPDPDGKIVMVSIGMSNTTQEFQTFQSLANDDREKSPQVVIVDGAQGGNDAERWSKPGYRGINPWKVLGERLEGVGVSPKQVQVAWVKQARQVPRRNGEFPGHARELQGHLLAILQTLKQRYPNIQIVYLSSRIYAGYASVELNPEPYAYESAFSVRWLIEDQIAGKPELNFDPQAGEVQSPLLLWGPYLWANGEQGREIDDLVWLRADLSPRDGTHPSASGRQKVAGLLLDFFKTDPTARVWFHRTKQ